MVLMMILSLSFVYYSLFFFFLPSFRDPLSSFLYTCCAGVFFDSAYTWPLYIYISIYIPPDNVIGTWLLLNGRQHVMSFFFLFSFVFHGAGMAGKAARLG